MKKIKGLLAIVLSLSMALSIVSSFVLPAKAESQVDPSQIHIVSSPTFGNIYGTVSFLKKNITVGINGNGTYRLNDETKEYTTNNKIVKLYRNGKIFGTLKTTGSEVVFKDVPVSYGKDDNFKVELYLGIEDIEMLVKTTSFKSTSAKVPNIKAYATKISSNKAYLRWQLVNGVTGYYIYMGKKKVKTVGAKTNKTMVSKNKAGKSSFKVVPYVKDEKVEYTSTSNAAKPVKNQCKCKKPKKILYATCKYVITKISLTGKTYTVTGYATNKRMWDVNKYKSLKIALKIDGKKAFSKNLKNVKLKIKKYKKKKITFKIKGKAGKDLAHGKKTLTVVEKPDWGIKNDPFKD